MKAATTEQIAAAATASGKAAMGKDCSEAVRSLDSDVGLLLAFSSGDRDFEAAAREMAAVAPGAPSAGMTGKGLITPTGPLDDGCVAIAFGPHVNASVAAALDASGDLRTA